MKHPPTDPVERAVYDALIKSGVEFTTDQRKTKSLDFYLPQYDIYIECCAYWTPRKIEQASRVKNIIIVQSVATARALSEIFSFNMLTLSQQLGID